MATFKDERGRHGPEELLRCLGMRPSVFSGGSASARTLGATLLWFDAVAAVTAFGTAALLSDPERSPSRAFAPALIGLGLAIVWVGGMASGQPGWASWLNFAFAVAFLGVAVSSLLQPRLVHVRH